MRQGKYHGDISSVREAEDMRFLYGVLIHKRQQILCKLTDGKRCFATRCLPMSTSINGDDTEMLGERFHLMFKITTVLSISMKQNQGEAVSLFDIVVTDIH